MQDTTPHRLTPTLTSRKVLALDFVRAYIEGHNISPSLGEIAAALHTNKTNVAALIRQLCAEGRLLRRPGATRGLSLPSERDHAIRVLRAAGWTIDDDLLHATPLTFSELPRVAAG